MTDSALQDAIARAEVAARNSPRDPAPWLQLATLMQQAQRPADELRVLGEALRLMPRDARLNFAAGQAYARSGRLDVARELVTLASQLQPGAPGPWLVLAGIAQKRGDTTLMLNHHARAARCDAKHLASLLQVGFELRAQGQLEHSATAFRLVLEIQPQDVNAWGNLAAVLNQAGQLTDALSALRHALALAPNSAHLHSLHGEIMRCMGRLSDSAQSFALAAHLNPLSADLQNRLGGAMKNAGDAATAEAAFRRALELEPNFLAARVNLATLCITAGKPAEARALLRQVLAVPECDAETRAETAETLAVLEEHEQLGPAIATAVAGCTDAPIAALRSAIADASLAIDDVKLASFDTLARTATSGEPVAAHWPRHASPLPGWPAFEAHFALHSGDAAEEIERSAALLAADAAALSDPALARTRRELLHYVEAVRCRRAWAPPADAAEWEARVRYWHATLLWEQPDVFPGQFKARPIVLSMNPLAPRTPPRAVAGTLRRLHAGAWRDVPPGPWRAALLYYAIVDIHPFVNGNGRLARFLANLELESAGFRPFVLSDHMSSSVPAALAATRHFESLEPLVEFFARAEAESRAMLESLQKRHTISP